MNIQVIAEHSVDMDLLPERANILDAGCRGFEFTNYFRSQGHFVIALDIDNFPGENYCMIALASKRGRIGVKRSSDPNATCVCHGNDVPSESIVGLSALFEVPMWDLIKLDIEGAEKEVIMSMDRPYATQLSIEFHEHTLLDVMDSEIMTNKLISLGYEPVNHERTKMHGLGLNYWDSLFILKNVP